ncbi:hypothetical protein DAETH_48340 (plasmid) [Deinococcus aetherius]|uniref:Phage protein n=1 Tax=Deinococcus aetherius TaxID=200252 RepID=A0ABM8ALY8_9DEIO|nr:hypothetical protein [Deinococcus aetherius]BDP44865.1 hypothetical protein DAETH_48340 [Deinococcus aetherius]
MGIKSKRVAFTFDELSLRTLEEVQDEGHFGERPVVFSPHLPPLRALPEVSSPLLELMDRLDAQGWQYKLTSALVNGERCYFARVWRADALGCGRKVRAQTRHEALARAWEAAQAVRRTRERNAKARAARGARDD